MNLNILINPLNGLFKAIIIGLYKVGITNLSITYFMAIFIFTLIIKSLIMPLTIKQTKTTIKTQELQPKIKALQDKYKNDPKTLQQKQMELYKENGANPLMGCLPLLIQLPIFMAMYAVIYHFKAFQSVGLTFPGFEKVGFLWVKSLGSPDKSFILPVLSGLTTYLSMLMMQPKGNDPTVKTQKQMGIFMSIFSAYIGYKFKSGLVLYWVIGNIVQMLQQYFIIGKVRRQEEENSKARIKAGEKEKLNEEVKVKTKVKDKDKLVK